MKLKQMNCAKAGLSRAGRGSLGQRAARLRAGNRKRPVRSAAAAGSAATACVALFGPHSKDLAACLPKGMDPGGPASCGTEPAILMANGSRSSVEPILPDMEAALGRLSGAKGGCALSDGGLSAEELSRAGACALSKALRGPKILVVLGEEECRRALRDQDRVQALRRDLENGTGLEAHLQPQVRLRDLACIGAEALARWNWNGEPVPPGEFIPLAEENGLIGLVGLRMLGLGARSLAQARSLGMPLPRVAVNVSPGQCGCGDFLGEARAILRDEGLEPTDIELEITETDAAEDPEFLLWIAEISKAGFPLAIDDFGSGSSSMGRLGAFPACKAKLDQSFARRIPGDRNSMRVFHATLNFAREVGMAALAEGIENGSQARAIRRLGCEQAQGYLWGRPMPLARLLEWHGNGGARSAAASKIGEQRSARAA